MSIHFYEPPEGRFGVPGSPGADLLDAYVRAADAIGKPLVVGELADGWQPLELAPEGNFTRRAALRAFELRVPLSLVWAWELYQFSPLAPAPGSVEPRANDALIAMLSEVSGWLARAPTARAETLAVPNAGFERDDGDGAPDGWTGGVTGAGAGGGASVAAGAAFLGTRSLRLTTGRGDATAHAFALSDPVPVAGGDDVVLSAALRRDLPPGATASLALHQLDEGGVWIDGRSRVLGLGGDDRFVVECVRARLDARARSVQVLVDVGPGEDVTLHVDDVRLSRARE